jgi:hypothetical protein
MEFRKLGGIDTSIQGGTSAFDALGSGMMASDAATYGHSWETKLEPGGYVSRCTICGKSAMEVDGEPCRGRRG